VLLSQQVNQIESKTV